MKSFSDKSALEVVDVSLLIKRGNVQNDKQFGDISDKIVTAWWKEKIGVSKHIIWFCKGLEGENRKITGWIFEQGYLLRGWGR